MSVLPWFIHWAIRRRMRRVARLMADPAAAQEQLLLSLVRRAAGTEWGRSHGYARVRSVPDFQRATPLCRYDDMAPLWHRAFDGARDVTWPGHIRHFALSSGTTGEICKALPVSRDAIRANTRAGATLLGLCQQQVPEANLIGGKTLYFGGSIQLEPRGQCLQGDASGIMAAHLPRLAWRYRLPEPDVAALDDWEAKFDAVCTRYLDSPVVAVAGLPSWTLLLFRRLADAARARTGRSDATVLDIWPKLKLFIYFGMAYAPYREQFEALLGRPIATIATYSSSEGGMTAVQSQQGDPAMQLELDGGTFYEFVPADEIDAPEPTRLTLDQVETGVDYAILLSTCSGHWAYDVGDVVRFTSLRPLKIVFAGRTKLVLNVFGEHVIQEELELALAAACRATGSAVRDFTVASILPTAADPRGGHRWLVEFEGRPPPADAFATRLDAEIIELNLDYKTHRHNDLQMTPPRLDILGPGTFYAWAARHDKLGGQHKVPRVALTQAMVDELLELSGTHPERTP